jgi:hypothetical protein
MEVGTVTALSQAQVAQQAAIKATKIAMTTQQDQGRQALAILQAASKNVEAQLAAFAEGTAPLDITA